MPDEPECAKDHGFRATLVRFALSFTITGASRCGTLGNHDTNFSGNIWSLSTEYSKSIRPRGHSVVTAKWAKSRSRDRGNSPESSRLSTSADALRYD